MNNIIYIPPESVDREGPDPCSPTCYSSHPIQKMVVQGKGQMEVQGRRWLCGTSPLMY